MRVWAGDIQLGRLPEMPARPCSKREPQECDRDPDSERIGVRTGEDEVNGREDEAGENAEALEEFFEIRRH